MVRPRTNVLSEIYARGDWLLRSADEIVIDSDTSGVSARDWRLQERIMDDIFKLCEEMNVRVRHGRTSARALSGRQARSKPTSRGSS